MVFLAIMERIHSHSCSDLRKLARSYYLLGNKFHIHIQGRWKEWKSSGAHIKIQALLKEEVLLLYLAKSAEIWGCMCHPFTPSPNSKYTPQVPPPLYIGKLLQTPDGHRVVHIVKNCKTVITFARDCVDWNSNPGPLLNWIVFVNCFFLLAFLNIMQSVASNCLLWLLE